MSGKKKENRKAELSKDTGSGTGLPESEWINVLGARVHNLKNIDVTIPRNKFTVITG
ncbi:hypothetical protein ES708_26317 [subsurface metagenome]